VVLDLILGLALTGVTDQEMGQAVQTALAELLVVQDLVAGAVQVEVRK
jgi:hypothetical protein